MIRIDGVSGIGDITKSQASRARRIEYGDIDVQFIKATVNDLKEFEKKSKMGDEKPTEASLKKMGFEKQPLRTRYGGVYYKNKDGDFIRIGDLNGIMLTGPEGSSYVTFFSADGKTTQEVVFDPYGEPLKGGLEITDDYGYVESYSYEYDLDGNKSIRRMIAVGAGY